MKETKIQLVGQEIAIREALAWQALKLSCETNLRVFFREAWPQFDSARFVNNWHLDAIAEHLEAVSRGHIKRLLVNVPPRSSKTNMVSIAWPVWTWAHPPDDRYPLLGAGVRFLCASYGANKAEADGVTARRLIGTEWFKERWGDRVQIAKDRDNQSQYDTTVGGSRISTGIPESLGKGGAIRLCFPPDQIIHTEAGPMAIGELVDKRLPLRVPSLNERSGQIELRPVTGWHRNPGSEILRLTFDNGLTVRCTPGHMFRIASGEWKAAGEIPIGAVFAAVDRLQAGSLIDPIVALPNTADDALTDPVSLDKNSNRLRRQKDLARDGCGDFGAAMSLPFLELRLRGEGPVTPCVGHVVGTGAVAEIAQPRIATIAVTMSDFFVHVFRGPDKGDRDQDVDIDVMGLAVPPQRDAGIPVTGIGCGLQHLALPSVAAVAEPFYIPLDATNPPEGGNFVVRKLDGRPPDFVRLVAVTHAGWSPVTYCITVAENHNLFVGDSQKSVIAANCDDPHKTDEVESDIVRAATVRSYDEVWRTRSNDPVNGAEVMIMQRLADGDLSGHLLSENDPALVHLMLPMEFDSRRRCHTVLGFEDPREKEGELLWPERFDKEWVANQRRRMGPHAWAGQFQQTPTLRGGGIILRDWWRVWPPEGQEDTWTREFHREGRMVRRLVFPDLEYVLLSCDTAYTEKEENDFSACIAWGVFRDEAKNPRIIMLEAWHERLELRALVHKIIATARRRTADAVLIEAKASGLSVLQEMRRLMRDGEFTLMSDVPKGDKLARLHAVSPAFSAGVVFAPDRAWAELVIEEVASFPRSRFKDLTDCVSSGIKKLRDLGLLQHTNEVQDEREEELITSSDGRASPREEYGL